MQQDVGLQRQITVGGNSEIWRLHGTHIVESAVEDVAMGVGFDIVDSAND